MREMIISDVFHLFGAQVSDAKFSISRPQLEGNGQQDGPSRGRFWAVTKAN